jgi:TM2 domain-containing membrane protein YozV
MAQPLKENHLLLSLIVALLAWLIPGAGHFALKEKRRAIIIFATIVPTFCTGLYIGSIGVIDTVGATPWYVYTAQIMASPMVALIAWVTEGGGYPVYAWSNEIGQIYTSTAGLLNLLCIVNAVYLAHLRSIQTTGD